MVRSADWPEEAICWRAVARLTWWRRGVDFRLVIEIPAVFGGIRFLGGRTRKYLKVSKCEKSGTGTTEYL